MKLAAPTRHRLLALLLALPLAGPALAHTVVCEKAVGLQKLRCERHAQMFASCSALKAEAHHACDREFLLAHPLACTGLPAPEATRCEAETAAFKACEARPGREFVACVNQATKESPMGVH